jgi:hypothetical protein
MNSGRINLQKTQQTFELNNHFCSEIPSESYKKKCHVINAIERALLLINTSPADSVEVISDLRKIEGISEVCPLKGMYDIAAFVEAESFEKLNEILLNQVKGISNIKAKLTLTLI